MTVVWILLIAVSLSSVNSFYIPGVAPVEYATGDPVLVKAVKLTSTQTQLPYEFYSIPICKPPDGRVQFSSENLGEVLRGDRIESTPYLVHMKVDNKCSVLCSHVNNGSPLTWSVEDSNKVIDLIKAEYSVHLLMDNLPAATRLLSESGQVQYRIGFPLGSVVKDEVYLNNYLKLHLKYHTDESRKTHRFVGFEVEARSRALAGFKSDGSNCDLMGDEQPGLKLQEGKTHSIQFFYSVEWQESPVRWASRWDIFLNMSDVQIHWFSIFNSLVFIFFLSGVVTMILVRTLRRDIAKYNEGDPETVDDVMEETGWKLVHGDVFRLPRYPRLFVAIVGSGIQILCMTLITLFFAMLGMLSPASRGALMTAAIFLYVFMGLVAGYYSARLYKSMKGTQWKRAAFLTSTLYPGIVFGTGFLLNFFVMAKKSSGAVPFGTMVSLLCLWFGISVPLVFLGYYFGYRKPPFQNPVRTNQIPRQIPPRRWYMNPVFSALIAGVLPFGAMFIELFFVFTAIWENQVYYLFGFLFVVFLILVISCAQISVLMIYFQLCAEDYHWWWRSLLVSGGSSVYVFFYSVFYFMNKLEITDFVSTLLYFGYTLIMVVTFAIMTGTVGFIAAYAFVRKIYAAVKID